MPLAATYVRFIKASVIFQTCLDAIWLPPTTRLIARLERWTEESRHQGMAKKDYCSICYAAEWSLFFSFVFLLLDKIHLGSFAPLIQRKKCPPASSQFHTSRWPMKEPTLVGRSRRKVGEKKRASLPGPQTTMCYRRMSEEMVLLALKCWMTH